ncbi:hypothetical protein TNCT_240611 [Trichonephila clavata]|uniref:Uncharacterized protein n=1 Tax=Trichonephila clavata TaxID=2740835 RepID=A0A8X6EYC8_TRICU|nr:hypothetical protein TNCT_240611 [Trichonephila clavata]
MNWTINLLTFRGNEHSEKAQNIGPTCPNEGATYTAFGAVNLNRSASLESHFWHRILSVNEKFVLHTIASANYSVCNKANLGNRSPNQISIRKIYSSSFGRPPRPWPVLNSYREGRPLIRTYSVVNRVDPTGNCASNFHLWPVSQVQYSCMKELNLISQLGSRQKLQELGSEFLLDLPYSQPWIRQIFTCFIKWDKQFPNHEASIQEIHDFSDQCDADFSFLSPLSLKTRWSNCISADGGYLAE